MVLLSKFQILRTLAENMPAIRALGVSKLGLFGSAARDEMTAASDLDFLVDFETVTFDAYMDLKFLLEDLFNRRVDLVPVDSIKPRLREPILSEAVYVA